MQSRAQPGEDVASPLGVTGDHGKEEGQRPKSAGGLAAGSSSSRSAWTDDGDETARRYIPGHRAMLAEEAHLSRRRWIRRGAR